MAAQSLAVWIRAALTLTDQLEMLTGQLQTDLGLLALPGSPSALRVAGVVVRVIPGVVVVDVGCSFG